MDDKKHDPPRIARNGRNGASPKPKSPLTIWIPSSGRSQRSPRSRIKIPAWMAESEMWAIGIYCGVAVLLALATKYTVSGMYWNLNFFLLFVQSSLAIAGMGVLRYMGLIETGNWLDRRKVLMFAPLSLLLVLSSYISLKALQCLSLPTYTILSNFETIVLAETASSISGFMTLSFAVMIIGGAGAVWSDYDMAINSRGDSRLIQTLEPNDPVLNLFIGCVFIAVSILLKYTHSVLFPRITRNTNLKDWDIIFYTHLLILLISGTLSHLIEDFSAENLNDNFPPTHTLTTILSLLSTGLLTPLLSYTSSHSTKTAGEKKTLFMKEVVNQFLIAAIGLMLFGAGAAGMTKTGEITDDGVLAIVVVGVGGTMYVWAKFKPGKERKEGILPTSSSTSTSKLILRTEEAGSSKKDYL